MFPLRAPLQDQVSAESRVRRNRRSAPILRPAGLGVESLEGRAFMAGDVAVSVEIGDLVITGDARSNGVQVAQIDATTFLVTGTDNRGGTTVNGAVGDQVFANVTGDIRVNLKGGDDVFRIGGESDASRMALPGSLSIGGGDGHDTIAVQSLTTRPNGTISVKTGAGMDGVSVDRVVSPKTITIATGDQNDTVRVTNSRSDRLHVLTGQGSDRLSVSGNAVTHFFSDTSREELIGSLPWNPFGGSSHHPFWKPGSPFWRPGGPTPRVG